MSFKWQSLILIVLILISLTITQLNGSEASEAANKPQNNQETATSTGFLNFESSVTSSFEPVKNIPVRKWDVLDPEITADVTMIHSIDDSAPLYYSNIHEPHVLASLTKLLTAVIVFEDIGLNKKIPITEEIVATQGFAANLKSGEVYISRDLIKLMLLTSSNDSAAAFEDYLGGQESFITLVNRKMEQIGMTETVLYDGSGLNDFNKGTASDILLLSRYILENHPQIFTWTRSYEVLIQPINSTNSRTEYNINSLIDQRNYLGGKTGTSPAAGENITTVFNVNGKRILIILMGSQDRDEDIKELINWIQEAYNF